MLISYRWLQRFFDDALPSPDTVADKLTFGAFEIEGIEKVGDDTIFDVSVLPDRACYALSHRGIAREIATLCDLKIKDPLRELYPDLFPKTNEISVSIEDASRARYYAAALVNGVTIGPSPDWLKRYLEAVGQQSINNIVDAANFVMFDLGTPLHVFDADKLSGAISVRAAQGGEKIIVLGGEEKELTEEVTVIADKKTGTPIAIAGVKGGVHAEISSDTKNIIIEAAKFDPVRTRKTAQALNLKTEASKRFENRIAIELPAYGMKAVVDLILEIAGGKLAGFAATELPYKLPYKLGISADEASAVLDRENPMKVKEIESVFEKLGFHYECIKSPRERAVAAIKEQVGKPYEFGASVTLKAPHTFDCSSLVSYAYVEAGVSIPRTSVDQYIWGEPVEENELEPGDLIFSNSKKGKIWYESDTYLPGRKVPEGVDHVGMYIGDGKVIHATRYAGGVVEETVKDSARFAGTTVGYRRVVIGDSPRLSVSVPFERLDLRISEDLIEEIGRVRGYGNIESTSLSSASQLVKINARHYWFEKIREKFDELGYAEIYTYSLQPKGDMALANAFASDKAFLRKNLADAMQLKLMLNVHHGPEMGLREEIKLFEIGQVFTDAGERTHVCFGISGEEANEEGRRTYDALEKLLGSGGLGMRGSIGELDITDMLKETTDPYPILPLVADGITYKSFSPYPFVLRDIALWVSVGTLSGEVSDIIQKEGGDILVRAEQFDEFTKENRTSYAFHLVFQSYEKTLSNEEVNVIMEGIQNALKNKGWEVR